MTVMPPQSHRTRPRRHGAQEDAAGRPVVFMTIMVIAALIVLWILMTGPAMPVAVGLGAVGAVLALVAAGWGFAGPHS